MAGMREWLEGLGLERYAQAFEDNDVDFDLAADLTDDDLKELGVVSLGHRKRLLRAIASLRPGGPAADIPAPPAGPAAAPPPRRPASQADRRQITVMFCDLADSTALSTRLDPEDYREVMRAYQDACAAVVGRYDGFIARYMGDGVLVYFGWPHSHEDDAERAVNAGLGIVAAVCAMAPPKGEAAAPAVRVGIATGPVVVGDIIGEGAAQEAAATGETPNLAARLQQVAPPHGVVVSAATRALVRDLFSYEDMGRRDLRGIGQAVEVWRVTGTGGVGSRFEAVRGRSLTRFVGRDHELALLRERWDAARDGEGQVVLLSGEAGIGKSRLMQALMEHVQPSPHVRLRFQCSPYDVNSALNPFVRHIERAARFLPGDDPYVRLGKLEALLAQAGEAGPEAMALIGGLLLLPVDGRYPPLDLTPQQVKQRTLDILAAQVLGLAAGQPVLFLFEDAHWIDPSSLELLDTIVSRSASAPVLAVVTQRPEWRAPFLSQPHVTLLQLSRLGRRQIAEIVRSVAAAEVPESLVENIIARADGIPLYVEEMTRSLVEAGFSAAAGGASDIPDTLQASLMARLDHLPGAARDLAQVASVIGREVPLALLRRVLGDDGADMEAALEDLFRSQLMHRGSTSSGEENVVFRHALIRDAAYQSLLLSRRREIHCRIAAAIDSAFRQTAEQQPELVARHYAESGDAARALAYWRRAGELATRRLASREAVDHYENALAQLALAPDDAERRRAELQLVLAMGVPLIAATGYASDEVRRTYGRARALAEAAGDHAALFTATRGLWNCVYDRAELDDALALAESLVRFAGAEADPAKTALAQRALGSTQMNRGALDDAVAAFDRCLEAGEGGTVAVAVRDDVEAPHIIALQYKGWVLCLQGRLDEGRALVRRAVLHARKLRHPLSLAFSLQIQSVVTLLRRDYEACRASATEALALAREHNFVFWIAGSKILLGSALTHLDPAGGGLALCEEGLREWRASGAALHIPTWRSFLADAALASGDLDAADAALAGAGADAEARHDLIALAELQRLSGLLAARRGDTAGARAHLEAAVATAAAQGAALYGLRAATDLAGLPADGAEHDRARGTLAGLLAAFRGNADTLDLVAARHAAGMWNPGVDKDSSTSSAVMSSAIPSNRGEDR